MKNAISFLIFITYTTLIFFLPNNNVIGICILINLCLMFLTKTKIKYMIKKLIKILPFIALTFVINLILDNPVNAFWVGIKLILVCNVTIIYSNTITIIEIAETIKILCTPLKIFKVNTEDIKIMVCISLSMIPILKKELEDIKDACKAKNIVLDFKNIKYILSKLFLSLILRTNQIEESLIAKGYKN